jgi:hypothetical protein
VIEYYVRANTVAMPFFSDTIDGFVLANGPYDAIQRFLGNSGYEPKYLFAARAYKDANAYHKHEKHLAEWLSDKAKAQDYK